MCSSTLKFKDRGLIKQVEAVLFVASDGATVDQIVSALEVDDVTALGAVEELARSYSDGDRGLEVVFLGGRWHLCTSPDVHQAVDRFRETSERENVKLSKAALETLAVIAYNQPVTRSEVEEIRGVRCERVIDTLLSHGMIRISGRRKGTGSPLLYRTGEPFLRIFGLGSISDLPTVAEIEELRSGGVEVEDEA